MEEVKFFGGWFGIADNNNSLLQVRLGLFRDQNRSAMLEIQAGSFLFTGNGSNGIY